MALSDALVIYFSCGSPFAIHVLMTGEDGRRVDIVARMALNLVAWPIIAAGLLYRMAAGNGLPALPDYQNNVDSKLKKALNDLEIISHVERKTSSVFELRDVFARYTALAAAFSDSSKSGSIAEVFEIAAHPDASMASICLSRRSRGKLFMHLSQARSEFVDFVGGLSARSTDGVRVGRLAMEVAEALDDSEGIRQLKVRFDSAAGVPSWRSSDGDGEQIWSTEQASPIMS